jgi:hypothetical protein
MSTVVNVLRRVVCVDVTVIRLEVVTPVYLADVTVVK